MLESEFQAEVLKLAKRTGWKHYHVANTRRRVPGFPDLVLVHRNTGRLVFAELKAETGRVSPAQQEWLDLLAKQHEAYTWQPSHLDSGAIANVLGRAA